jgi:hypothetical protein
MTVHSKGDTRGVVGMEASARAHVDDAGAVCWQA